MTDANPAYLLLAIVTLCIVYAVVTLTLDLTGNRDLVTGFSGLFIPIIMGLLALKIEVIRRNATRRSEEIMTTVNGNRSRLEDRLTESIGRLRELESWCRKQHPNADWPGNLPDGE